MGQQRTGAFGRPWLKLGQRPLRVVIFMLPPPRYYVRFLERRRRPAFGLSPSRAPDVVDTCGGDECRAPSQPILKFSDGVFMLEVEVEFSGSLHPKWVVQMIAHFNRRR